MEITRIEERYRCRCGSEFDTYYDSRPRMIRDLPYGPYKRSWLCFHQTRVEEFRKAWGRYKEAYKGARYLLLSNPENR